MHIRLSILLLVAALSGLTACSGSQPAGDGAKTAAKPDAAAPGANATKAISDDVPAPVKAAFATAQSVTTEHKALTDEQVAMVEKGTGTKIADRDHHTYIAYETGSGARKQTGAATVVKAGGAELVIVYDSRNGLPIIREVRATGVDEAFLAQFKNKGHDDAIALGKDIKAAGVDEATAKAIADAVRQDSHVMQALYGKAHSH